MYCTSVASCVYCNPLRATGYILRNIISTIALFLLDKTIKFASENKALTDVDCLTSRKSALGLAASVSGVLDVFDLKSENCYLSFGKPIADIHS